MPLYDYKCREHGLFYALASLDESGDVKPCPACGKASARVIVLPPQLRVMDEQQREARERNERSRHQPLFSNPEQRREAQARREHKHGKGCGCGQQSVSKSQLFYTADGKKMFPSMRPWMISH
ncbi:FmdB family zinc ribbon protein [Marinimicrobium alkaliphilum]|uniref:FmdB family zinc ribbon protein n=1 Tax=Marinimicrobium alkaliphilum TaxID=2202654 RepID=UPI000DB8FA2B|nr:FmdB family zinc ribbon protein [Marinimicrobium alkaliphilum]